MSAQARAELEHKLQAYVGQETGPAQVGPEPVNDSMIQHWCEALGDRNAVYGDAEAAQRSVHGGIVAPPTMLQAWFCPASRWRAPPPCGRTSRPSCTSS